jgi:type IV secretion system protein VirB4
MMDLRAYGAGGARLSDFVPWAALIAPGVVLNKDGAFQRTVSFRGADLDSATPAELIGASARLNNILRRFGSGWCLHIEARRMAAPAYPRGTFDGAAAWLIDEERRQIFEAAGARFETVFYLTMTYLPPAERTGRLEALMFEGGEGASHGAQGPDYRVYLARFLEETDQVLTLLHGVMAHAEFLDDEETLTYLHGCVSDRVHRVARPAGGFHLDGLLCDAPLTGGLTPRLGARHLRVISVRSFVSETEPGLLDALNRLPLGFRWVTRFLPLDREDARRELEKVRKRWFSKRKGLATLLREALFREEAQLQDNDAANQANDADLALQELGADAVSAGYVTLTLTVLEESPEAALDAVRLIQHVTDGMGFVTEVETVNAVEAWLGSLPGQAYADIRRPIILTPSLAHLAPTSAVWAGALENRHVGGPALMVTATEGSTPFRVNLHVGDVGHTMIVGPTGAGKSVLLATLAAQFLRYEGAQVYVFDKGRSSRALILGLAGDFFDLGEDAALGLQPLARLDDAGERSWALDWVMDLVEAGGLALTPEHRGEVWRALEILSQRPVDERTLSVFCALVQDPAIRAVFNVFTHAGAYGRLLDHDRSSLGYGRVQAFEMDDLLRRPAAAQAVLPVLFHELERRFTGAPSLLILDEAWLYLREGQFAARIQDWLKTLRKRNVAVVFASQELGDLETSAIASTLFEAVATRIFLPNDRAREPRTRAFYERLGLNARQIARIASGEPKRDYYLVNRCGCRMFELGLGPAGLAFVAASTPEDQRAIDHILARHGADGFAARWLIARDLPDAAKAIERFNAAPVVTRGLSERACAQVAHG